MTVRRRESCGLQLVHLVGWGALTRETEAEPTSYAGAAERQLHQARRKHQGCPPCAGGRFDSYEDRLATDVLVAVLQTTGRHHVDTTAQKLLQIVLDPHQVQKRRPRLELHQEVDVAVETIVSASDGAEHGD